MAAATTVRTEQRSVECSHADADGVSWLRYRQGWPDDVSSIHPDCARPFRLACRGCPHFLVMSCEAADERKCPPCAKRYRGRVQHVAQSVLEVLGDGDGLFITTTPPGDRQHGPKANPCPCTPAGGVDIPRWNAQQGKRVNNFRTQLRRVFARHGVEVDYFRCVELQDGHRRADGAGRMGLQDHWVVVVRRGRLVMTRRLEREIKRLGMRCGYGHAVKVDPIQGGGAASKVARYVSKYVSKAVAARGDVPWRREQMLVEAENPAVDDETGELDIRHDIRGTGARTYKPWTTSRSWGTSMGRVRAVQRGWSQGQDLLASPLEETVWLLMLERGRTYGWASHALVGPEPSPPPAPLSAFGR